MRLHSWWPALRRLVRLNRERLAPDKTVDLARWSETLLLPVLAIGLAWWASPDDPLLTSAAFPWLWLAPTLVALRYGVLAGLVSTTLLLGDWLLADALGRAGAAFPRHVFFGGGLLVLICGEFSDVWRDRLERMDETNIYIAERLSRLTKRHLLLNLSHDRLEQEMLARPGSLRDALVRLRDIAVAARAPGAALPDVEGLLQLLAQYVNIEAATLYRTPPGAALPGVPAGTLGEPEPLAADDAMLQRALAERQLVHIASEDVTLERPSTQLVVAPLIAGDDTLIGVLAVSRLPFFSLNVENLQMLSVILAYYADHVHGAEDVAALHARLPTLPVMYAQELSRLISMQRRTGLSSQIVVMSFVGEHSDEIPAQFLRIKRGLDLYWQTLDARGHPVIAVLMPFAAPAACEGFVARIDGWLRHHFGGDSDSLGINIHIDFAAEDPVAALQRALA